MKISASLGEAIEEERQRLKAEVKEVIITMELENILKGTGKVVLIGAGIYLTYEFLMAYYDILKEEGRFDKDKREEEYPLFI